MPTEDMKIYDSCSRCLGTKIANEATDGIREDPCMGCGGSGMVERGTIGSGVQIDKILRRLKKIMDKIGAEDD